MKIERIKYKDSAAQRVYDNYMKRIEYSIDSLAKEEQVDILMEFNSHLYEGVQHQEGGEMESLLDVIDKLGDPEIVLKPLIADKKLEQATKTFNPIHVFKALMLNIGNGISYFIFFLLYIFLFAFIFLIYAKLTNPDNVGLFFEDGDFLALGLVHSNAHTTEVLGNWFVPFMILAIVIFYILITLLLKLKRNWNKR